MVCLGPRKKEKKANLLSPDDVTSRGLKKSPTSKLRNSKTNTSLAPSIASNTTKKTAPRSSLDTGHKTGLPRPTSRNSLVPNNGRTSPVRRPVSRPASRPASPHSRPTAGSRPAIGRTSIDSRTATGRASIDSRTATGRTSTGSRPSSIVSVKSNHTTASVASTRPTSRNSSKVSSTATSVNKQPLAASREELKGLKAQNEENKKLIADQKAELERLKQQLSSQAPAVPAETTDDAEKQAKEQEEQEAKLRMLKTKEEELLLREKEIEQLRVQLENTPAIVIQPDEEQENKAEILAQKERSLQEKEAQLEEQKRLMEEKVPGIDQVALQLEALKAENLNAVNQLASKEKELEELRSLIHGKPTEEQKEGEKQEALEKIEQLNKQLEAQKKAHEESLRKHEEALAEKELMLEAEKQALKALEEEHEESLRKLKTEQSSKIIALKKKHKQDKIELEKQVEEAKKEAEANPAAAIDIDEHLERMLQEFEQAEHTHAVQIQSLEESHQSELNHLENNQKAQLNKLKHTQNLNRDSWTTRYLPTDAVSWPLPNRADAPKLRPTPLVESKSKTLLRVLGNMPGYQKPEPVLTPLDPKKVQVYYSSVSGNAVIKRNQEQIQQLLKTNNIKFSLVDVAQSDTARQYAKKANNNGSSQGRIKDFPQLFVGGEYRGQFDDLVRAIDDGTLEELLHAAEERHFTAEERAAIQKAELNEEMAGPMRAMPTMEALPQLRPTRSTNKPVKTLKDYDEDEELLKALEKEFNEGNINLDDL